ncbi:MAG: sigma-70 family RNA polymerase sigma factor [Cyclobacteriaceae bacterium]|nr:sigma-70 family RNA polymerase sigma factor [Cyclobacteriaceae bacterium]
MKEEIEDIIIGKIKSGDLSACRYIVDKYKSFVFNIALRILKNREDAEEVAQDSFVKAFKAIDTFKYQSKFSTWLYRITFNNAISRTRQKKFFQEEINEDITESKYLTVCADGLENLNRQDRRNILRSAIENLNKEESLLISLYYYEENSMAEVADITGLDENLVKVKIHRARKKLHNTLFELLGVKQEDVL